MNVDLRIAQLEGLLVNVSSRRSRARVVLRGNRARKTAAAAWDRLERDFRTALASLEGQRHAAELAEG